MSETSASRLVGVAIPTLREMRAALIQGTDPDYAVSALRDAGYAGGESIHAAFEQWLRENGSSGDTGDLGIAEFGEKTAEFFRDAGWGEFSFSHDEAEGIAILDMDNCWEAVEGAAEESGCQVTTGMLAAFFGKIAGYPISVMETECTSEGHCQFILGNAETMQYRWETANS